jgi:hypothetical protein
MCTGVYYSGQLGIRAGEGASQMATWEAGHDGGVPNRGAQRQLAFFTRKIVVILNRCSKRAR